jgi:hypothetical protein
MASWSLSWKGLGPVLVAGWLGIGPVHGQQTKPTDDDVDRAIRACSLGTTTDAGVEGGLDLLKHRILSGEGKVSEGEIPSVIGSGVQSDAAKVDIFDRIQKCVVARVYGATVTPSTPQSHDPNALYQYGEPVADVQGAVISQAQGMVTFQALHTAGKADPTREVEYQDWVLSCPDLPRPPPNAFVGQFSGVVAGEKCTIVRKAP